MENGATGFFKAGGSNFAAAIHILPTIYMEYDSILIVTGVHTLNSVMMSSNMATSNTKFGNWLTAGDSENKTDDRRYS